jgi:hypothetical protein
MEYIRHKIKLESLRILYRCQSWIMALYEPWLRFKSDKIRPNAFKINDGGICVKSKVAIFLIYQHKGLSSSIVRTCIHLVDKGYAPLIISNSPLCDQSLKKLKEVSWKIVFRSNFGYDFGGYRDGLWLLDYWKVHSESLIIMNDSIWFPLYDDDTTIECMESSSENFLGLFEGEKQPGRFRKNRVDSRRPFFGSYFWMLKHEALVNPGFTSFWTKYKSTSSKSNTIRHGEMKFTKAMIDAGISNKSLLRMEYILDWLNQRSNIQLLDSIDDLTSTDPRLSKALEDIRNSYEDSPLWRVKAFDVIGKITCRKNILATSPTLSVYALSSGFFKKGSDVKGLEALRHFVKTVNEGKKLRKPHPSIWAEMEERCLGNN